MSGKLKLSDGDWLCGNDACGNLNFARRSSCNKCGTAKDVNAQVIKNSGSEIGKNIASKSKGLFSAEDWQCSKCGNINWARRMTCNVCNGPKLKARENRTGIGGGYMERDNVDYIERDDSDSEFDEFGRKKKKFRGKDHISEFELKQDSKEEGVEEKEEEKEEDDEDEDDSFDASKYDLSASDDEDNEPSSNKRPHSSSSSNRSRSSSSSSSSSSKTGSHSQSSSKSSRSYSRSRSRSPKRSKR